MRTTNQNQSVKNVRTNKGASQSGSKRPENKDNLDSRENEEQDFKGDDTTPQHQGSKIKKE